MQTVAKTLVQHLKQWQITHVFGIPGKPVTPLILEMDRNGITFVLCKHECGAGFAAAGYATAKRTLGVALGTAGPGGTNMLTAAGQAKATHTPVLFLTGQPPIKEIGKVLGQDSTMFGTDLVRMFESVTKFSARVERSDLLEVYLRHAIEQACTGVPGPVHLSIPLDVLFEEVPAFRLEMQPQAQLKASNLDEVVEILDSARRPIILAGIGVHTAQAYRELEAFAERWNIPVMTTPGGKGTFRSRHPLSLGPFGLGGCPETEVYMQDRIDVMLVLGSQLSDLEVPGLTPAVYPRTLIHFDHDLRFIGKAIDVPTIPVLGNLKANLQAILKRDQGAHGRIQSIHLSAATQENESKPTGNGYMSGRQVMHTLREALPGEAIMFGDAGSHSFYAIKHYEIEEPGTFFFEEVFASMGRAIGYSIGAQIAKPDRVVVCLTGDGCMFMNGTEVSTAANYGAPVLFIVFNNGSLDMVDKGMARHLGRAVGTVYSPPLDAARFGQSMGAASYRCTTEYELRQAVAAALREQRTAVIDIIVDPNEIPPTMKRG
ncbi:thiamine pyrophosphate-binding protein [Paenibacillus cymbidii]|uniref:thiamine pyrophosphate-binding protein n=1 Tax=Paenibacillus cymbidii TaxID=1639034 RepID=UPI001080C8D0|nr:thiamine pyrophosphate-binding protein [Paenibacillus cymbidii]